MKIEERIKELGFTLPEDGKAGAVFVSAKLVAEHLVFTSGCTPRLNGAMAYTGKCGTDLTIEDSQKAAQIALINALSAVKSVIGDLDRVKQIVKLTGFVNSTLDFTAQPKVIDGASLLLKEVFGEERGAHTRSAVGIAGLPGNAACEIELIVEI